MLQNRCRKHWLGRGTGNRWEEPSVPKMHSLAAPCSPSLVRAHPLPSENLPVCRDDGVWVPVWAA